jgi:radical SAM superfamily enzyme YgiQ (UPF0313 family)
MKLLLVNPCYRPQSPARTFPLGLAYVAAAAEKTDWEVEVLDIEAERIGPDETENRMRKSGFDALGFGGMVTAYSIFKDIARAAREINPGTPLIVGNSLASTVTTTMFENTPVDIMITNEGDLTIGPVLEAISEGRMPADIPGVQYRDGNALHHGPPGPPVKDLDSLPLPAWHLFPMDRYLDNNPAAMIDGFDRTPRIMPVVSGRGCPYRCHFCYSDDFRRVRYRSIDCVLDEIETLQERYDVDHISFIDDLFAVSRRRLLEFIDKKRERRLQFQWECNARVDFFKPGDEPLLDRLRESGLLAVGLGVESGNQDMLERMNKGTTVRDTRRTVQFLQAAGLGMSASFILGYPGETEQSLQDTFDFCIDNHLPPNLIPDEEEFLSGLNDITQFRVNLTDIDDTRLQQLGEAGIRQVRENYYRWAGEQHLKLLREDGIRRIGIFGLADRGRFTLARAESIGFEAIEIFDSDPVKIGSRINGNVVKHPEKIPENDLQVVLVTSERHAGEMMDTVREAGGGKTEPRPLVPSERGLHLVLSERFR